MYREYSFNLDGRIGGTLAGPSAIAHLAEVLAVEELGAGYSEALSERAWVSQITQATQQNKPLRFGAFSRHCWLIEELVETVRELGLHMGVHNSGDAYYPESLRFFTPNGVEKSGWTVEGDPALSRPALESMLANGQSLRDVIRSLDHLGLDRVPQLRIAAAAATTRLRPPRAGKSGRRSRRDMEKVEARDPDLVFRDRHEHQSAVAAKPARS